LTATRKIFARVRREIGNVFRFYEELGGKVTAMEGGGGTREARKAIREARQCYPDLKMETAIAAAALK
jgi:hypothetical protein